MTKYRNNLPQLESDLFLTDGGIETTLVFHDGADLPHFASFQLLRDDRGTALLRAYFDRYVEVARAHELGLVLETPTWRASPDWAAKLGVDGPALDRLNRRSVELLLEVRRDGESERTPVVVSGNIGPRGDGYRPTARMSAAEAQAYHARQVEVFAGTEADMIAALTLNYVEEAIGVARAAQAASMPVVISFTTETDGRLPSRMPIPQAIQATDEATGGYPAYYMINCVHPTHLAPLLEESGGWRDRIRGLRANASRRSHQELDESTDLDEGDPEELAREYRELRRVFRRLTVLGGCCGTDHRHVAAIARALQPANLAKGSSSARPAR